MIYFFSLIPLCYNKSKYPEKCKRNELHFIITFPFQKCYVIKPNKRNKNKAGNLDMRCKHIANHTVGVKEEALSLVRKKKILAVYEAVVLTSTVKTSKLALAVFPNTFFFLFRRDVIGKPDTQLFNLSTLQFSTINHKNYNFLDCDWFRKLLFPTNSLVKLLSDSLLSDTLLSDSSISQSHSKLS